MYIKKLCLQHFGKYHKRELELQKGINVIYGPNEAGKTTIKDFIIGMFYGIDRQRGLAARTDEYVRREPLEGADYSGSMELEQGDVTYLIDRTFRKEQRSVKVYQRHTGREIPIIDTQSLQDILVDLDKNGYTNTLCISSHGAAYKQELQEEFRQYLMNVSATKTSNLDLKDAYGYLNNQKKAMNRKGMENELQNLSRKMTDINLEEALSAIGEQRQVLEDKLIGISDGHRRKPEIEEEKPKERPQGKLSMLQLSEEERKQFDPQLRQILNFLKLLLGFGLLAIVLILIFLLPVSLYYKGWLCIIALVVALYAGVMYRIKKRKGNHGKKKKTTISAMDASDGDNRKPEAENAARILDYSRQLADLQVQENELLKENAEQEELQLHYIRLKNRITEAENELQAIDLALTTIQALADNIYDQYGAGMNQRVSELVARITNGRYTDVRLDEKLDIKVRKDQRYIGTEFLSTGTLEQIYLAVRLAVAEEMSQSGMPLMLDDIFGSYDDARLEAVLQCLMDYQAEQVILFTANDRLADVLDRTNMDYNYVEI